MEARKVTPEFEAKLQPPNNPTVPTMTAHLKGLWALYDETAYEQRSGDRGAGGRLKTIKNAIADAQDWIETAEAAEAHGRRIQADADEKSAKDAFKKVMQAVEKACESREEHLKQVVESIGKAGAAWQRAERDYDEVLGLFAGCGKPELADKFHSLTRPERFLIHGLATLAHRKGIAPALGVPHVRGYDRDVVDDLVSSQKTFLSEVNRDR